jgi:hypothetical protein
VRLEVEVKRPGKTPTAEQQAFLDEINNAGGVAVWADSVESLEAKLLVAGVVIAGKRAEREVENTLRYKQDGSERNGGIKPYTDGIPPRPPISKAQVSSGEVKNGND